MTCIYSLYSYIQLVQFKRRKSPRNICWAPSHWICALAEHGGQGCAGSPEQGVPEPWVRAFMDWEQKELNKYPISIKNCCLHSILAHLALLQLPLATYAPAVDLHSKTAFPAVTQIERVIGVCSRLHYSCKSRIKVKHLRGTGPSSSRHRQRGHSAWLQSFS